MLIPIYMHRVQRPPEFKKPWASHQPPQPSCSPPFQKRSARRRQQNNTMQRKLHNSMWRKQCNTLTALQPCVPYKSHTHEYRAIDDGTTYCATKHSRVGLTHPGSPTLGRCMCGRTVGPFKRPPTLPLHTLPSHHTPPL